MKAEPRQPGRRRSGVLLRANLGWDAAGALAPLGAQAQTFDQLDAWWRQCAERRTGDHVLVMSNGGWRRARQTAGGVG